MIKPTDIRLNNQLMQNGQACSVVAISPYVITVEYANEDRTAKLSPDQFEGMDLTEELLLRSGFVQADNKGSYHLLLDEDIVITVNPHITGGISVQLCVKDHWCGKPVNNLHQLQNMFLELTGDELQIEDAIIDNDASLSDDPDFI